MEQTVIPAEQWTQYSAGFSRAHHGWLVKLVTIPTAQFDATSAQVQSAGRIIASDVRLQALDLDPRTGRCGIAVQTQTEGALVEHRRNGVMDLFRLSIDGVDQGLRIDSVDAGAGESTLIWFRAPAATGTLDGVAEFEV